MALAYNLLEAHFVALPSQSNIYGLEVLQMVGGISKILVASLRRPIVCVEYVTSKPFEPLVPSSREVHFTYIPGGAEIISIDSFNKSLSSNDFIVGITFSKDKPGEILCGQYFNIYTDWEPKSEFSLESIAQSCRSLELNFIPYMLFHAELWKNQQREIVWLLSGSDASVHLYREDKTHAYVESSIADYFPEFTSLPSIMLWTDVKYFDEHSKRLTAMGCENGHIRAVLTDMKNNKSISTWEIQHDSPISSVRLFTMTNAIDRPSFLQTGANDSGECQEDSCDSVALDLPDFHLLVTSTLEVAVVYWSVLSAGFKEQKLLPNSDGFDCVQCSCIADVDMDGMNELILGTYGQELLVYKYDKGQPTSQGNLSQVDPKSPSNQQQGEFYLVWQRSFAYPVLAINYLDITGDGMRELVVLSTKGLHILQHNLEDVANLLTERLERLVQNLDKNDAFKELQGEDIEL